RRRPGAQYSKHTRLLGGLQLPFDVFAARELGGRHTAHGSERRIGSKCDTIDQRRQYDAEQRIGFLAVVREAKPRGERESIAQVELELPEYRDLLVDLVEEVEGHDLLAERHRRVGIDRILVLANRDRLCQVLAVVVDAGDPAHGTFTWRDEAELLLERLLRDVLVGDGLQ